VRGMRWARVAEFEMMLDGKKITEYRATAHVDKAGDWYYTILPELVEPLKRAFGLN
jgi:hypothetical protein